MQEILCLRC